MRWRRFWKRLLSCVRVQGDAMVIDGMACMQREKTWQKHWHEYWECQT